MDKELLLKDLCGRVPYGVKVSSYDEDGDTIETLYSIDSECQMLTLECNESKYVNKPYLYPLSSMTEEDYKSLFAAIYNDDKIGIEIYPAEYDGHYTIAVIGHFGVDYFYSDTLLNEIGYMGYDWLNAHHYDYRGLIRDGLAIDATNLNIY